MVVAHPDDEVFVCGSLIAHATDAGAAVTVVCATRGELGECAVELEPGQTVGSVREAELRVAVQALGASVVLLDHLDSGFDGPVADGSLCGTSLDALADELGTYVDGLLPHVVVTLDGSDGHRDHRHLRDALVRAVSATAHGDCAMYECALPNALMRRWLDEARVARPDDAYHAIDPADFGRPDADITDVLDQSHLLERRFHLMSIHRSQRTPFDGLSRALAEAFLGTDFLVRVPIT